MPGHGELIERWCEGPVEVSVRHSCAARDLYELRTPGPLPAALRPALAADGPVRGSEALYVVEVDGRHQLTVAPARGRLVVMPRLAVDRPAQRAHALAVARLVASLLAPPPHEAEAGARVTRPRDAP